MLEGIIASYHGSLCYPVHLPNIFHRQVTVAKSPPFCSVSKSKPSSLLINNNYAQKNVVDSNNPARLFPNHTVGIIGGVSTEATLHFLHKVVELSSQNEGEEAIPFIVCNDPILKIDNFHGGLMRSDQRELIVEKLRERRVFLEEKCGACCIVMPCHTLQLWHEDIAKESSVPFLRFGDCVSKELEEANLKPIEAGRNVRIGILSIDSSLTSRFYHDKLQNQGFEVVNLDKETMEHTVIPAMDAFRRNDIEGATNLLRIAIRVLQVKAVNTIIFASHDLSRILPRDDPLLNKCIDPIDSLAREAVRRATAVDTRKL